MHIDFSSQIAPLIEDIHCHDACHVLDQQGETDPAVVQSDTHCPGIAVAVQPGEGPGAEASELCQYSIHARCGDRSVS